MDMEGAVSQDGAVKDITGEVEEGGDERGLEAFFGNGIFERFETRSVVLDSNLGVCEHAFLIHIAQKETYLCLCLYSSLANLRHFPSCP